MRRRLKDDSGLTLIEIMVVLFILALFSTLVVQTIGPKVKKAEIQTATTQIQIISVALDTYRLDVGRYPDSLDDLLNSSEPKWNGPYIKGKKIPLDPWGDEYVYSVIEGGDDYDLYSVGKGEKEIRSGGAE